MLWGMVVGSLRYPTSRKASAGKKQTRYQLTHGACAEALATRRPSFARRFRKLKRLRRATFAKNEKLRPTGRKSKAGLPTEALAVASTQLLS